MNAPLTPRRQSWRTLYPPISGSGLLPAILRQATQFNFYQFCQLLERATPQQAALGSCDSPAQEPVRFCPLPSLGFPGCELARVELDPERPQAPPVVRTTFLGLYGVDARMPWHVPEHMATRRDGHEALAGFLDLFSHRIATLYYRSWSKYRYPVGYQSGARDKVSRSLLGLVGLGIGQHNEQQAAVAERCMALLGQGGQRTRTAEGLAAMVRQVRPDARVLVQPCHPVRHRLDTVAATGSAALCAGELVLGRSVIDRNSTVRVVIQPQNAPEALLPGARDHADLLAMLRIYLGFKFDAELVLRLDPTLLPATHLGRQGQGRLGLTAMAGRARGSHPIDIRLGRYRGLAA